MIPVNPILLRMAGPDRVAQIVDHRRLRRRLHYRRCRGHWRHAALMSLVGIIAVNPVLVALALPVYATTIVHHGRITGRRFRCANGRCRALVTSNPTVINPVRHPHLAAISVNFEPTVELIDNLQNRTRWRRLKYVGFQTIACPQIDDIVCADEVRLCGCQTMLDQDRLIRIPSVPAKVKTRLRATRWQRKTTTRRARKNSRNFAKD